MRVIIAGSRSIHDFELLKKVIGFAAFEITEVVSGGASGVDRLGERWAKENAVGVTKFLPDWSNGRGAGIARNIKMGDYADALIALWDGQSRGTRHMTSYMVSLKKPLYIHRT